MMGFVLQAQPPYGARLELVEECRDWHVETARDLQDGEHAGVALAALDAAQVIQVHLRSHGQFFLTEAALLAQPANRSPEQLQRT